MEPNEIPLMYRWNSIAAEERMLRPDGLLSGAQLRLAIRYKVVLKCGFVATSTFMRTSEHAIRRSIGRAQRRDLLDWDFVQQLNDQQLERAAYTRLPRTSKKTLAEARELNLQHLRKIMGDTCDS
jgi:hypothetical protein